MTPALMSSSLYVPIAASNSGPGIAPVSLFLLALTITIHRIWLLLSLGCTRLVEDKSQVSPQMRETFAHDLRTLLCLGEDECALQNRLDEVADAFGAPWRIGRVELFCGGNIARNNRNMRGHPLVAGGADIGMRGVGFLNQRAKETGVVRQIALQNLATKIDIAEQPL